MLQNQSNSRSYNFLTKLTVHIINKYMQNQNQDSSLPLACNSSKIQVEQNLSSMCQPKATDMPQHSSQSNQEVKPQCTTSSLLQPKPHSMEDSSSFHAKSQTPEKKPILIVCEEADGNSTAKKEESTQEESSQYLYQTPNKKPSLRSVLSMEKMERQHRENNRKE